MYDSYFNLCFDRREELVFSGDFLGVTRICNISLPIPNEALERLSSQSTICFRYLIDLRGFGRAEQQYGKPFHQALVGTAESIYHATGSEEQRLFWKLDEADQQAKEEVIIRLIAIWEIRFYGIDEARRQMADELYQQIRLQYALRGVIGPHPFYSEAKQALCGEITGFLCEYI
jgi:hypothetical protein